MPFKKENYPSDWKQISLRVREAAGNRCEFCGVANKAIGARDVNGCWHDSDEIESMSAQAGDVLFTEYPQYIRIVLTVAHLDHDTRNNDLSNLRALCQKCHLTYDAQHHAKNAAKTRANKKRAAIGQTGQLELFGGE